MKYDSNTLIEEKTVRHVFNSFEYAYPEMMKVWIGVDTSYTADDVYIQGMKGYESYMPYYWQLIGFAFACICIWLLLLVYLTVMEGRFMDEEGNISIRLKKWIIFRRNVWLLPRFY